MSVSNTLALATAALMVLTAQANAAQKTTQNTTENTKAAAKQVAANDDLALNGDASETSVGARRPTGGDAPAVLNANSTVPVTKSSASLPAEIQAAAPRRVFAELYTETYDAVKDINNKEGSPRLDSYAGVKYDFGNARAISLRQNFDYTGLTDTRANAFHIQDLVVNYTDAKLATFASDGSLTLIAREYLPTGENSRFLTGNVGAERIYLIAAKSFGKLDLDVLGLAQLSNNTKDSYIGADGKEAQNRWGLGVGEFDALYNFSSKFAAGVSLEVEQYMYRSLAGKPDTNSDTVIEPIIQFTPAKGIAIQAALVDTMIIGHPTRDLTVGRDDEIQAYLNFAATL